MRNDFNDGWKFYKLVMDNPVGEQNTPVLIDPQNLYSELKPEQHLYSPVNIPHDYLIYNTQNLYETSAGFYKKEFNLSDISHKRISLEFGGVYMNWALFVNGKFAGQWKYGYTSVEFEITSFVKEGLNVAEVVCIYQNPNTRWYSGAGIFRDVKLNINEEIRFACNGIYFSAKKENCCDEVWNVEVDAEVEAEEKDADHLCLKISLINSSDSTQELELFEVTESRQWITKKTPDMGQEFWNKKILNIVQKFTVKSPALWDVVNPACYNLEAKLFKENKIVDSYSCVVGFRTIEFNCEKGLLLNNNPLKIKGVCQHHDLGMLGAAFDVRALKRQFAVLKEMGVNAIRTSHNPQDNAFYDLADRMGFLVCNEAFDMWEKTKTTYDYGNWFVQWHERDCSAWVRRTRNHPSLLMWSIGNEIYDTHSGNGLEITKDLCRIVSEQDRNKNGLTTIGSNYMQWQGAQNCADLVDLVGYNYAERLYSEHHQKYSDWCIYGSETSSTVQSRGIYHFPLSNRLVTYPDNQCSSLGNCSTSWGASSTSAVVAVDSGIPYSAGQFIWTGWDYIGEPTPYFTKNSYFGQIDTAGFRKDTFYGYKAGWVSAEENSFVHVYPYWDFNEGQKVDVRIFSNAYEVELFVNKISQGRKKIDLTNPEDIGASWQNVIYHKGSLIAVAYDCYGNEIARDEKKSFGDSDSIVLDVEEISNNGLYFIDISTLDKDGVSVDNSRSRIFVNVQGAELVGLDNGDSTDYEQYVSPDGQNHNRKLFGNKLLAMVRSSDGNFCVTVKSKGLKGRKIVLKNGSVWVSEECESDVESEIPVRRIELVADRERILSPENKSMTIKALVHPADSSFSQLNWAAMMLEGVPSDCASVSFSQTNGNIAEIEINGTSDGSFVLSCSCNNGTSYQEISSELDFETTGFGTASRNPFELIEGCKCSSSLDPVQLSFEGGVFTKNQRTWFAFEKVDFGKNGSDSIIIPIFSFDTQLPVEIWDGVPDDGGKCIYSGTYSSPSVYNVYSENTFNLEQRLFGLHTISFVFTTSLSFKGFRFIESAKAYAKLNALDAISIVGDSFVKTEYAVEGIGNNVVLNFKDMDFGNKSPCSITVCGFAHGDNTIHVKFRNSNGNVNTILEFKKSSGYVEQTFCLEGPSGKNEVDFVFLPGSNFDFKWFRFTSE